MKNIPIIKYEHIRDMADSHSIRVKEFESQIAYLKKRGYEFLSLDEFSARKMQKEPLNEKCVLVIFEGGWRDFYENAYPILKHFWAKAGVFIATEWIEESSIQALKEPNMADSHLSHNEAILALAQNPRSVVCTWEELRVCSGLISFGSMTHTYQLSNFVRKPWHEDAKLSKDLIAKNLKSNTTHLLWPRGQWDQNLLRTAKTLGFASFYTAQNGTNFQGTSLEANNIITPTNSLFTLKKQLFVYSSSLSLKLFRWLL
ncbi:polysaccharide deacetylase family protein [Helicobacter himalayensis]|uniref:polysaccharide deacetylase family protein n=1 Tax=Helicobacter himalayensis TaxID=1591088 RepID=UPI00082FAB63|nr:polysaccharide deacetylase family protein [Helicobacter himalayensis]